MSKILGSEAFRIKCFSLGDLIACTADLCESLCIREQIQSVLERLKIFRAHQNRSWPSIPRYDHSVMLELDSVYNFGKMGLYVSERKGLFDLLPRL